MLFLADNEFLAHFWQYDPVTFFRLGQKTKSDSFHKRINVYLLNDLFQWPEKQAAVLTQNYFGKFCCCVPMWAILKHGLFQPLGGPLSPCGSLQLWSWLFIQIHSVLRHCEKLLKSRKIIWRKLVFGRFQFLSLYVLFQGC